MIKQRDDDYFLLEAEGQTIGVVVGEQFGWFLSEPSLRALNEFHKGKASFHDMSFELVRKSRNVPQDYYQCTAQGVSMCERRDIQFTLTPIKIYTHDECNHRRTAAR